MSRNRIRAPACFKKISIFGARVLMLLLREEMMQYWYLVQSLVSIYCPCFHWDCWFNSKYQQLWRRYFSQHLSVIKTPDRQKAMRWIRSRNEDFKAWCRLMFTPPLRFTLIICQVPSWHVMKWWPWSEKHLGNLFTVLLWLKEYKLSLL